MSDFTYMACMLPSGDLDNGFDDNGIKTIITGLIDSEPYSTGRGTPIAVDKQNNILTVCYDKLGSYLVRLKPNGDYDETFGDKGVFKLGQLVFIEDIAVDEEDRILILHNKSTGRQKDNAKLSRYTNILDLDTSFANNGTYAFNIQVLDSIVLGKNNKMFIVGSGEVVKLTEDGYLDTTFGDGGYANQTRYSTTHNSIPADTICCYDSDSETLIWEFESLTQAFPKYDAYLYFIDAITGELKVNMANNGIHKVQLNLSNYYYSNSINDIKIDSKGRIVYCSSINDWISGANIRGYVARLLPNGNYDETFNPSRKGYSIIDFGNGISNCDARKIVIDNADNIIALTLLSELISTGNSKNLGVGFAKFQGESGPNQPAGSLVPSFGFNGLRPYFLDAGKKVTGIAMDIDDENRVFFTVYTDEVFTTRVIPRAKVIIESIDYEGGDIGHEWKFVSNVNNQATQFFRTMQQPGLQNLNVIIMDEEVSVDQYFGLGWQINGWIQPIEIDGWWGDDVGQSFSFSEILDNVNNEVRQTINIEVSELENWGTNMFVIPATLKFNLLFKIEEPELQ